MTEQPAKPKKKMSWKKKTLIWVGGIIAGFIILGIAINIADPEGMDEIRAEQEAERQAKASEKASEAAAKESAKAEEEAANAEAQSKADAEKAKSEQEAQEAQASQKAEEDKRAAEETKAAEEAQKAEDEKRAAEEAAKNDPLRLIAEAADVEGLVVTQKGGRITADFPIADNMSMRLIQRGAQNDTIDILRAVSEHAPAKYEEVLVMGGMDMQDSYGQVTEGQKVLQAEYSKETIGKINYDNVLPESIWELRDFGLIHNVLRETE